MAIGANLGNYKELHYNFPNIGINLLTSSRIHRVDVLLCFDLYMHTYHSHLILEGEASQIFLRDAHVLPK
jgi:hypothetical protein